MRSRRQILAAAAALVMLITPSGGRPLEGALAADPDPASSEELQDAFRFRTTFGLAADPVTLADAAAGDGRYVDREFGVPLSTAEAAEIRRRVGVQEALTPASAYVATVVESAGVYIDQLDLGLPVFLFVGNGEVHRPAIEKLLPPGTEFRIASAEYTYAELLDIQARVEAAREGVVNDGIDMVLTGLDVRANRVIVGVEGLTPAAVDALSARFGPGISTRMQAPTQADACSYLNCWPLKGGIEIYRTSGVSQCTSGFIVKRASTSTYGVITAGHCIEVNGGYDKDWFHGTTSVYTIGRSQRETWQAGADADVGIIHANAGSVPSQKNRIYTPGDATTYRDILAVTTSVNQNVGMVVCRSGRTSGWDCGTIVAKNVTKPSCVGTDCRLIDYVVEVDFDSMGGDSGGPIHINSNALGTHVDSERPDGPGKHGWYSPLDFARTTYYDLHGISYNVCTSSDCSIAWPY